MQNIQLTTYNDNIPLAERVKTHAHSVVQGECLQLFREARGLSRQELADELGVTVQTIFGYEKNVCKLTFDRFATMLMILSPNKEVDSELEAAFRNINSAVAKSILERCRRK